MYIRFTTYMYEVPWYCAAALINPFPYYFTVLLKIISLKLFYLCILIYENYNPPTQIIQGNNNIIINITIVIPKKSVLYFFTVSLIHRLLDSVSFIWSWWWTPRSF